MPSRLEDISNIQAKVGVLGDNALGSAYVQNQSSQVTVGVFGPKQISSGEMRKESKINVMVKFDGSASIYHGDDILDSSKNQQSDTCILLSDAIHQTLTSILIQERQAILQYDVIVVCHFDFDVVFGFDAVLIASGLACADAGLQMIDLIGSTTVLFSSKDKMKGESVRPDEGTRFQPDGILRVVSTTNTNEVVYMSFTGSGWHSHSQEEAYISDSCENGVVRTISSFYKNMSLDRSIKFCMQQNSATKAILTRSFH